MKGMRVAGKVVGGKVVVAEALPEGADVVVHLGESGDEDFVLSEALRGELREAACAADRGELVDLDDVLAEAATAH
jgi:hypothetical protein